MAAFQRYISASEIGDFTYCKRGWWLRKNGYLKQNEAMARGTRQHVRLERSIGLPDILQNIGLLLVLGALLYALFKLL